MNLWPILRQLKIQDRDTGLVVPWNINWAQQEYIEEFHRQWNANKPVRIIVLKARQLGISTATQALKFTIAMNVHNTPGLTVAHEMDSSEHLLGMSTRYWETYPYKRLYTPKYQSRKHLEWEETGSSLRIVTAKNLSAGRSRTIRFLHASEVAFWEDAEPLMLSLKQTVPVYKGTAIIIESTANGIGNWFYDQWYAAVEGETEYAPMFFPWWRHPQYRASHIGIAPYKLGHLDEEEQNLRHLVPESEFEDRIAWRRYAIKDLCNGDINQFHQEYPATPEEAFVSTGLNVFPIDKLNACYEREEGRVGRLVRDPREPSGVRFVDDVTGPLVVYRWPSKDTDWGRYAVGGDPSGTIRGDYACAQVINRRDYSQVARFRMKVDPLTFAEELYKLGMFYNEALLATEATGPGYGTIGRLIEMNYPWLYKAPWADRDPGAISSTYGWNTTHKTKEWAIGNMLKLVVDADIVIRDPHTYGEMRNYVTLKTGGYGPASDKGHDDTVMSLAIAYIASTTDNSLDVYLGPSTTPILPKRRATEAQAIDPDYWDLVLHGGVA